MKIISTLTKKFVALMMFVTLLTAISPFHVAYAGLPGNIATESTQVLNNLRLNISTTFQSISASANQLAAGFLGQIQIKEFVLDPIAWVIAKRLIASITDSLVQWINSGFQGRPAFVTELDKFLLNELDAVVGDFLLQIPALDFVCSPFSLDVQFAIAVNYQNRTLHQPQARCTASNAINNIQGFLQGDWSQGGFGGLFEIAANPQNTPYGAYLETQIAMNAAMADSRYQETKALDFGEGFLSQEVCDSTGDCYISTPGQVIEEALTFQLSTGQRSLVTADEIDEIFGALLSQLVNTALQGVGGLLGLTSNSYTSPSVRQAGSGFSGGGTPTNTFNAGSGTGLSDAFSQQNNSSAINISNIEQLISDSLALQNQAIAQANAYDAAAASACSSGCSGGEQSFVDQGTALANSLRNRAFSSIITLNNLQADLANAGTDEVAINQVINDYTNALPGFVSQSDINSLNAYREGLPN